MRRLYDVLTVEEAAAEKQVTQEAVRKRIQFGRLPAEKVGGRYLIRKSDLDAWTVQRKRPRGCVVEPEGPGGENNTPGGVA
jgi:excisionase family DNA binding protein